MSKMGSIWTSKNFLTTETTNTNQKSLFSIIKCKIKKKLINKSQDNEFRDKSNLDTCQKWAQFGPKKFFWRLKPPVPARNHWCLSKYAKQKKAYQ